MSKQCTVCMAAFALGLAAAAGTASNAWGLHDLLGNASEWTQDCWNESCTGTPADGRTWESGECGQRVFRGSTYSFVRSVLRLARRAETNSGNRCDGYGFRVVRTLGP